MNKRKKPGRPGFLCLAEGGFLPGRYPTCLTSLARQRFQCLRSGFEHLDRRCLPLGGSVHEVA